MALCSKRVQVNWLSCTRLHISLHFCRDSVRSLRFSFAINKRIAFAFFSCPYLDASIQGVPFPSGILAEAKTKSHSEILGSKAACAYPKHIATCCVLRRSLEPSHPPFGFLLRPYSLPLLVSLIMKLKISTIPFLIF